MKRIICEQSCRSKSVILKPCNTLKVTIFSENYLEVSRSKEQDLISKTRECWL